jgi:hypothetical protein
MNRVLDKFGQEIFIDSLVAVATNSGVYLGRVLQLREYDRVQVKLAQGRKMTYDHPEHRMINIDAAEEYARSIQL